MTKIIHIADPHIDSPLRGLTRHPGLPDQELRAATRKAFANAVDFAISEAVDLVLIAGDLFDGTWRDMGTGLWTLEQFLRLRDAEIPVGLIRGNHDALSKIAPKLNWPENVREFGSDSAETWVLSDCDIAVHGQSFGEQAVSTDLAANYPTAVDGCLNIGLLHTSLAGSVDHDTYAPTTPDVLAGKSYDYWALGHIHERLTLDANGPVCFAGNLQGRHVRETGPKGVMLLETDESGLASCCFKACDVVRWANVEVSPHVDDSVDDILAAVESELVQCRAEAEDRPVAARVSVRGTTGCYDELSGLGNHAEFAAAVQAIAREHEEIWIEKVSLRISPPVDIADLRQSDGLLAALFDELEQVKSSPGQIHSRDVATLFAPLVNLAQRKDVSLKDCGIDLNAADDVSRWVSEAESILLATLSSGESR